MYCPRPIEDTTNADQAKTVPTRTLRPDLEVPIVSLSGRTRRQSTETNDRGISKESLPRA